MVNVDFEKKLRKSLSMFSQQDLKNLIFLSIDASEVSNSKRVLEIPQFRGGKENDGILTYIQSELESLVQSHPFEIPNRQVEVLNERIRNSFAGEGSVQF